MSPQNSRLRHRAGSLCEFFSIHHNTHDVGRRTERKKEINKRRSPSQYYVKSRNTSLVKVNAASLIGTSRNHLRRRALSSHWRTRARKLQGARIRHTSVQIVCSLLEWRGNFPAGQKKNGLRFSRRSREI